MVRLEPHHAGPGELLGHAVQQLGICAVPAVHGLVRVADDEEIRLLAREEAQEPVLRVAQVLHLVDEQVAVPPTDRLGEGRVLLQEVSAVPHEVVEVEHPAPAPLLLVAGVELGDPRRRGERPSRGTSSSLFVAGRPDEPGLRPADLGVEAGGVGAPGAQLVAGARRPAAPAARVAAPA